MITSGILGKVGKLASHLVSRPVSKVYDASKNKIKIAKLNMVGLESFTISAIKKSEGRYGVSKGNYAAYKVFDNVSLTLNFLPTSDSIDTLKSMATAYEKFGGYFVIEIYENGNYQGRFKGIINDVGEQVASLEGSSRSFTLTLIEYPIPILSNMLYESFATMLENE